MSDSPPVRWIPMRVRYVSRYAWPGVGGIEVGLRRLTAEMMRSHDVRVLAQRTDAGRARPVIDTMRRSSWFEPFGPSPGVARTEPLTVPLLRRLALVPLLWQASAKLRGGRSRHGWAERLMGELYARVVGPRVEREIEDADIVHVLGGSDVTCAAVRAARRLGTPVVETPFAHPGHWDDDAASAAEYRCADMVIGNLHADADVYRRLGVSDDRLGVCGPIVEPVQGQAGAAAPAFRSPHVVHSSHRSSWPGSA
jgi:hypothetical protein